MEGQWICVNINNGRIDNKNIEKSIKKELNDIFKDDLLDVIIINTELGEIDLENSYIFAKCKNYFDHLDDLVDSRMIYGIVGGYKNPDFIPEKEVVGFISSVDSIKKVEFKSGDIVFIRDGYLKNMYGIVIGNEKKKYEILFKLYTRCFVKKMKEENLNHTGENIFDKISGLS